MRVEDNFMSEIHTILKILNEYSEQGNLLPKLYWRLLTTNIRKKQWFFFLSFVWIIFLQIHDDQYSLVGGKIYIYIIIFI